jgi:hypothetical protein
VVLGAFSNVPEYRVKTDVAAPICDVRSSPIVLQNSVFADEQKFSTGTGALIGRFAGGHVINPISNRQPS